MNTTHSKLYSSLLHSSLLGRHLAQTTGVVLATTCACAPVLAALPEVSSQDMPHTTLPTIAITATRTPNTINNTIAQTRVIDSEALKHFQGQTALDVIKRQPGFSHYQSGGTGTTSSFYLRGYDSQSVLVLIDGIRYNAASTGRSALESLPADQIEKIEVLYGASGSSIYGADAVGGVIQIFTKGKKVNQSQFSVTAGAGSNDHYLYGATAQMTNKNGSSFSLSASRNQTKGFDAIDKGSNAYEDDDGFSSNNFSLSAQHKVNDAVTLGATGLYIKSNTEYDSGTDYPDTNQDDKNYAFNTFVNINQENLKTKLQYGESSNKRVNFDKHSPKGSIFDTKQKQANLLLTYPTNTGNFLGGAEWLKQEADTNRYQSTHHRNIKSVFAGYLLDQDKFDAQANIRHDDNSLFGSKTTYNLGVAYKVNPSFRAGASFSTGFRAPTLDDMYDINSGNPNLKPEDSENFEVFIENNNEYNQTRLTGYYSDVKNLIDYNQDNNWKKDNIDKARIKGITLTSDWVINPLIFGLSYDYQDAKNLSGEYKGEQLKFRPKHKGLIYLGYKHIDFDLRAEVQHIGKRYALDGSYYGPTRLGTKMDHINLVNLSANYYFSPNLTLNSQINNLFNKEYTTIDTYGTRYNQDGTNFFTSLTYTWK